MMQQTLEFEKPIIDLEIQLKELERLAYTGNGEHRGEVRKLKRKINHMRKDVLDNLTSWQRTQLARHPNRPYSLDYIGFMCGDFVEMHGDRLFADDPAVVAGLGRLNGRFPLIVAVIGQQKGRETREKVSRSFGMPRPEGYRKALRLMKLAEKFQYPVITLIDTPGAFPGIDAEARGQAEAIARNLLEMSRLKVPIVAVIVGEGGSGGALALGLADRVVMLENSIYSVISPEACSSILWKSSDKAAEAAEALKLTAPDIKSLGVIDEILKEPPGGAHREPERMAAVVRRCVTRHLRELLSLPVDLLLEQRFEKFRRMGKWVDFSTS
ncbi:MAG: acetyl-CoA carboxylase carboxyltransferase subunit alpha [Candidatus Tectomicrobia bacterium]|uniref:Acetyl-coenzyme A carboxylase carboxyl transferase subunit alpha n=1 Tax=Tectimicrobiota bacterium TaxID=2528274 RepID=A0A932GQM4_UNCTE|nr:acetyl-CoA carboxylase carboxyltransferase subunit alpha [Candidatus Tectomicrobia bacterium]